MKSLEQTSCLPPWYLQANALEQLKQRVSNGQVSPAEEALLADLINLGFCIIKNAIPESIIDQVNADVDAVPQNRNQVVVRRLFNYQPIKVEGLGHPNDRLIDFYVPSKAALETSLAPSITNILSKLYDEPPLAFQSLLFRYGSEQALHQDTAYVVNNKPLLLTASWVALEDIQSGTGELCYYPGSHLQKNQHYLDDKKIWELVEAGTLPNADYLLMLEEQCEKQGLDYQTFLPKKGDVLIWLAELAHGGSPITHAGDTRQSYVTHYCPASDAPKFFQVNFKTSVKIPFQQGFYTTRHYDVRPASRNPYPTFYGSENLAELRDRTTPKKLANIFIPNFEDKATELILAMMDVCPDIYLTQEELSSALRKSWEKGLAPTQKEFLENTQETIWRTVRARLPLNNVPSKILPNIKNSFHSASRVIIVLKNPYLLATELFLKERLKLSNSNKDLSFSSFLESLSFAKELESVLRVFDRGRCLILIWEDDVADNPQIAANKIADHLDIKPFTFSNRIDTPLDSHAIRQRLKPADHDMLSAFASAEISSIEQLLGRSIASWQL